MRFAHPAGGFCRIGDEVSYTIKKTTQPSDRQCRFLRLCCTMEKRLDTVEAFAEHGVLLQGSSECSVQRSRNDMAVWIVAVVGNQADSETAVVGQHLKG